MRRRRGDPSCRTSAMSLPTAADGTIVNERALAVHWHAPLRKFSEWASFRFGTTPGTAAGSPPGMTKPPIYRPSVIGRPALIFPRKMIYCFYRYRFYATVITSVCAALYLSAQRLFCISGPAADDALGLFMKTICCSAFPCALGYRLEIPNLFPDFRFSESESTSRKYRAGKTKREIEKNCFNDCSWRLIED